MRVFLSGNSVMCQEKMKFCKKPESTVCHSVIEFD